jgi:hypothetical protein
MNKLVFAGYSSTLLAMASVLTYCITWLVLLFEPVELVPQLISHIPAILMLEAMPVAIFATIFLKIGGGLNYFKTWNAGRKLRLSGIVTLIGFAIATIPAPIDILTGAGFRYVRIGNMYVFNPQYMTLLYTGLFVMACGLATFAYLGITKKKV